MKLPIQSLGLGEAVDFQVIMELIFHLKHRIEPIFVPALTIYCRALDIKPSWAFLNRAVSDVINMKIVWAQVKKCYFSIERTF